MPSDAIRVAAYVLVNIPESRVELYQEPLPSEGRYARRTDYCAGAMVSLPLAEGRTLALAVNEIFGWREG